LIKSLEKSLRLLGADRVELFLVHRPDWLTRADDTAGGLNQLLREGKIRAAGVSNYTPAQFDLLNSHTEQPLATNQVEFHLLHIDPIVDGTLPQCEQAGVSPMAWSPLAGGRLLDPSNEAAQRIANAVAEMAPRYGGASVEQLAFAWILAHPSRPLPIIGTNRIERIRSAATAADIALARDDWYALWQAAQGRRVP
jgi:predicted oxidoreductase